MTENTQTVTVADAYARRLWEAGTLTEWLGGAPPSRALLDALAQYKAGASERIAAMGEK